MKRPNRKRTIFYTVVRTKRNLASKVKRSKYAKGRPVHRNVRVLDKLWGRHVVTLVGSLNPFNKDTCSELLWAVHQMRDASLEKGKRVTLDMRSVSSVKALGALKLHAEIETVRTLSKFGAAAVRILPPRDHKPRHWLMKMGFGNPKPLVDCSRPGILPICSGTSGDGVMSTLLPHMNASLYDNELHIDSEDWTALHRALSEAMLNVEMHAYKGDERAEIRGKLGDKWWLVGQTIGSQLHLCFFDKGIGIPRTVMAKELAVREWISKLISAWAGESHDAMLIKAAMQYGRSGLKQAGNGLGLEDIKGYVERNPKGKLHILSNKGRYMFDAATKEEALEGLPSSMHGTLIQWNISLEKGDIAAALALADTVSNE